MQVRCFFRTAAFIFLIGISVASAFADTDSLLAPVDSTSGHGNENHKIVVYYFYFMPRCETCINMELYAKEAVETGFTEEIKAGAVEWHSFNVDQEEYRHFWDEFKLETKSLIMVDVRDGIPVRWKNCEKIWDLVNVKPDFLNYVQEEVRNYRHDG